MRGKKDDFDVLRISCPTRIQRIIDDVDSKVKSLPAAEGYRVLRYTTDVPDVRYVLQGSDHFRPVFLRMRLTPKRVLLEIEPVFDPLERTVPREKGKKWDPRSPRSSRELELDREPSSYDEFLIWSSMWSSMTGRRLRSQSG